MFVLTIFGKSQGNEIKNFSRKYNSIKKDDKLSRKRELS